MVVVVSLVRLLRVVSLVVCVIVAGWFLLFAVDQTKSASSHQQEVLAGQSTEGSSAKHEGGIRHAVDETGSALTAPFGGIVGGSHSEWGDHGIRLLAALLVYGFGVGYLARVVRVRV